MSNSIVEQYNEPALVLNYGPSGSGKTCDLVYSFPRALFLAAPGALIPAQTVCGYKPARITTARTLEDAMTIIEKEGEKVTKTGRRTYDAMIIDDMSLMSDATAAALEQTAVGKSENKYAFWAAMRKTLLRFRDLMGFAGMHIIANAHERPPHTDEKKGWVPGGPMLPGSMPADMPKSFSSVLRTVYIGPPGWPNAYAVERDESQYVTKNRYHLYGNLPMNIGEMLRIFYGTGEDVPLSIRRLAAIPWQEQMVEKIAKALRGLDPASEDHARLRVQIRQELQKKFPNADPRHIEWTRRDGIARAIFLDLKARSTFELYG